MSAPLSENVPQTDHCRAKLIQDVLLSCGGRSAANALVFLMHHGIDETTAKHLVAFPESRHSFLISDSDSDE